MPRVTVYRNAGSIVILPVTPRQSSRRALRRASRRAPRRGFTSVSICPDGHPACSDDAWIHAIMWDAILPSCRQEDPCTSSGPEKPLFTSLPHAPCSLVPQVRPVRVVVVKMAKVVTRGVDKGPVPARPEAVRPGRRVRPGREA
jgi:hypothetical protein